ncbi:DUF3768 domain-containing protein [Antarcticirhabdus aurantiaca]|uniref:DUF3768 domain-containing protein n=1 Tax=Antarcticirhabdus aurantiaca TaxID=2606717 RepID=A0ACD4NLZ0_9HYPH|nr:DUF3768 domain-containing protein [Antarcticirhabdus aurantiaca]WAJ27851.1 DUF3768 domain-containing protein [Jeongeuplla avenae]
MTQRRHPDTSLADVLLMLDGIIKRIRRLNDDLRVHRRGCSIIITAGIAALGPDGVEDVLDAIARFDDFAAEDEHNGLHDFGTLVVHGVRVLWRIDCYDQRRFSCSPDAADPGVTWRVLTIMRADEC